MRRLTALAFAAPIFACTCGDVAEEPGPAPKGSAPAAGPVACTELWAGEGDVSPRPIASWDRMTLEEAAQGLGLAHTCDDRERVGAYQTWSCEFLGDPWGFSVAVMEFDTVEDAEWAVKDPYPGEYFQREDRHVLQVEARNGACGEALLKAVLGSEGPHTQTDKTLAYSLDARGWPVEECSSETVDGQTTLDCTAMRGQDNALQLDMTWAGDDAGPLDEQEREDGLAWWWFEHGEATAIVHDSVAAKALAGLLVE